MASSPAENRDRLFGAEFKGTPCHNRVLKPPGGGSSVFLSDTEPAEPAPTRRRNTNHLQSSVLGGSNNGDSAKNKPDGNPVTGEGYVATNGEKAPAEPAVNIPVVNGTTASKPASAQPQAPVQQQQQQRARVPPGGFSSGLW